MLIILQNILKEQELNTLFFVFPKISMYMQMQTDSFKEKTFQNLVYRIDDILFNRSR